MLRDFFYKNYLGDGEEIVFVIHRHLFMQMKDFGKIIFFGGLIPAFVWWLFPPLGFILAFWPAIGFFRFIYEFFDWYYDVWLVTNVSIIEIMWQGFFEKSSARIEYHIIQGIGYEVKGFIRTIFNYGDITLDKFTGNPSLFVGAVNPKNKAELLANAQDEFVKNKNFRDHQALQGLLGDMLQQHVVEHGMPSRVEQNQNTSETKL